jgi:hypothetical protein
MVKGMFFADLTWLWRCEQQPNFQPAAKAEIDKVWQQLQWLINKGHYVFPHVHPHWLDAEFVEDMGEWDLSDNRRYAMYSLQPLERMALMQSCLQLLHSKLNIPYDVDAFRAGGWCIQPFEVFSHLFDAFGFKHDFTVQPGFANTDAHASFDFSSLDQDCRRPYTFSNEVCVQDNVGKFTEWPISVVPAHPERFRQKVFRKILWKTGYGRTYGDGLAMAASRGQVQMGNPVGMLTMDNMISLDIPKYLQNVEKHSFSQFISHPKMLTPHGIKSFNSLLSIVKKRFDLETDWLNMGHLVNTTANG